MKNDYDILVIDDEEVVVESVLKIGEINNYKIDTAFEAEEALEKIKKKVYNLIICDIMLPDMDGFQILNEIHNLNIDTPVIMTTGFTTLENAVKSLYGGAIDFIPKPFTFDEMTSTIIRGLKYNEIIQLKKTKKDLVAFIPCPPKYFRLGYSSWVYTEHDGSVVLGATNCFIKTIEPIKKIIFNDIDENVLQASPVVKFIDHNELEYNLYSAISGRIISRNEKLLDNIVLLEKDPYFDGWLYKLIPSELDYEMKLLTSCSSDRT